MKRLFIVISMLCLCAVCYAEVKVYVDNSTGKEVQDLSGEKTLSDINSQLNGTFVDITEERKAEEDKIAEDKEKALKEKEKVKSLAINKLKSLGLTEEEISSLKQ